MVRQEDVDRVLPYLINFVRFTTSFPMDLMATLSVGGVASQMKPLDFFHGAEIGVPMSTAKSTTSSKIYRGIRNKVGGGPGADLAAGLGAAGFEMMVGTPTSNINRQLMSQLGLTTQEILGSMTLEALFRGAPLRFFNALIFDTVFGFLNEHFVHAHDAEEDIFKQCCIGAFSSLVAHAMAWPLDWCQIQMNLQNPEVPKSIMLIFQDASHSHF